MPTKTDQSLPRQQDGERELGRSPRDEVRSFASAGRQPARNHDRADEAGVAGVELTDDPGINTHGSER
jgi:hypothetical protein